MVRRGWPAIARDGSIVAVPGTAFRGLCVRQHASEDLVETGTMDWASASGGTCREISRDRLRLETLAPGQKANPSTGV